MTGMSDWALPGWVDGWVLMQKLFRFLSIGACLALAACGGSGPIAEDPGVSLVELSTLPDPSSEDYLGQPEDDVARPFDQLSVIVFGVPELSREVRISATGAFDFPLVGLVQANGRPLPEISHELEARLAGRYVLEPDVTIEFGERIGQSFTIGGEVREPGRYEITAPTSLMEAVAIGGGSTEYSRMKEVIVFRQVGGQRFIGLYDMTAIQRGNYPDPRIHPRDTIMVGDSPSRRLLAQAFQYSQLLSTPLILIDRLAR